MLVLQDSVFFLKPKSHTRFHALPSFSIEGRLHRCLPGPCGRGEALSLLPLPELVTLYQVSNVWINSKAHLLILGRAHADRPLHDPPKWVCSFRGTSSSCLSWLHQWPILHPFAAGISLPSWQPSGVGVRGRINTNQTLQPRQRRHCRPDLQDARGCAGCPAGTPLTAPPSLSWLSVFVLESLGALLIH